MTEIPEDVKTFVAEVITDDLPLSVWAPAELRSLCEKYITAWNRRALSHLEPVAEPVAPGIDPDALDIAAKQLAHVWPGGFEDQSQKKDGSGWVHPPWTPNDRARAVAANVIAHYNAAILASQPSPPDRDDFGPGDDSDPAMTALKRVVEDGSLPDNARRAATLAAAEISKLRSDRDAIRKGALEEAHKAVRVASEAPIHSGEMRYVAGHRLGVDRSLAAIRALASDPTPETGEDWVLVPREPTDEMWQAVTQDLYDGAGVLDLEAAWKAMIAASPKGTRE